MVKLLTRGQQPVQPVLLLQLLDDRDAFLQLISALPEGMRAKLMELNQNKLIESNNLLLNLIAKDSIFTKSTTLSPPTSLTSAPAPPTPALPAPTPPAPAPPALLQVL